VLVDNGPGSGYRAQLAGLLDSEVRPPLRSQVISGQGNVGFGRGHNLAWRAVEADYHLVLNPDIALAPDAIDKALQYLRANMGVVVLAPEARGRSGERLYLCKRYPSVLDLALRGFAPAALRRSFRARLERYEMRDVLGEQPVKGVPIVSGSFMFCRRPALEALGGFAEEFFLYFEDFDLSLRAGRLGELAWVPSVRIVHYGGEAARKGWRHIWLFARSAITFFNRHGWKWA
jgi:GT2 family glycosyltransferase